MDGPVCLMNAEYLYSCQSRMSGRFDVLLVFSPLFQKWIDGNLVSGSAENTAIASRMLRLFAGADWAMLIVPKDSGLGVVKAVFKRLRNLVLQDTQQTR